MSNLIFCFSIFLILRVFFKTFETKTVILCNFQQTTSFYFHRFSTRDEATGKSTEVSLVAFFKNRYGIRLRHLNLPALEVGPTHRHNWLPMEVCCISPNQKLEKKLTSQQSTAMLLASKQTPSQREADIHKIGVLNNYNNDLYASEFGVKVGKNLVEIKARVLNPPKVSQGCRTSCSTDDWLL